MQTLPISVLVPTRNSIAQLPRHVELLRDLRSIAQEIVVVDSESTDGSVELLRRELPQARFLTHPPGLYESWNFGVNACAADFVYISTVGDAISADGLRRLVAAAEKWRADVVVSPPDFRDEGGRVVEKRWPINTLIDALPIQNECVLEPQATLLFAAAFLRQAILGSSASNLYRRDCLSARPFPTDFGHAGDVGWGLRHAAEARLAIVPEKLAAFVFHPRAKRTVPDAGAIRLAAMRSTLSRVQTRFAPGVIQVCTELCDAWERLFEINARRRSTSVWMLRSNGWRDRWAQNRAEAELLFAQGRAFELIRERLRS